MSHPTPSRSIRQSPTTTTSGTDAGPPTGEEKILYPRSVANTSSPSKTSSGTDADAPTGTEKVMYARPRNDMWVSPFGSLCSISVFFLIPNSIRIYNASSYNASKDETRFRNRSMLSFCFFFIIFFYSHPP